MARGPPPPPSPLPRGGASHGQPVARLRGGFLGRRGGGPPPAMVYVIHNSPCTWLELSRASSFVWPLPTSIQRNEKPEGTISAFFGVSNVENAQSDRTEVNLPTVVIDFLETNAL